MLQTDRITGKKPVKKRLSGRSDCEIFMRLTHAERRRILREQAKKILVCYTDNPETNGMGGGDFVGCRLLWPLPP